MNQTATLDIRQAFKDGWEGTKKHFLFLVGMLVIVYGVSSIPAIIGNSIPDERQDALFAVLFLVISIVGWLVQSMFSMGLIKATLHILDARTPTFDLLISQRQKLATFVGANILYGIIVSIGLIFFIIPGIYLALKYYFFAYRIVDADDGVVSSLRHSGEVTKGVKWQLFGFAVLVVLTNVVGTLALGVGLLVTTPLTMLAAASVYRQLNNRLMPVVQSAPVAPAVIPPAV